VPVKTNKFLVTLFKDDAILKKKTFKYSAVKIKIYITFSLYINQSRSTLSYASTGAYEEEKKEMCYATLSLLQSI